MMSDSKRVGGSIDVEPGCFSLALAFAALVAFSSVGHRIADALFAIAKAL